MNTCYVMTAITFACLLTAFFQSFMKFSIFNADHVTFIILTSIVYCFTETLVIFFFVGTGVSIKEYTLDHKLDPSYHKRSIGIKRKVYPPLLVNMLFMMILFILVGAVDTHRFPLWLYSVLFAGCIYHYIRIKMVQNQSFKENTQLVLDMSGIEKKVM